MSKMNLTSQSAMASKRKFGSATIKSKLNTKSLSIRGIWDISSDDTADQLPPLKGVEGKKKKSRKSNTQTHRKTQTRRKNVIERREKFDPTKEHSPHRSDSDVSDGLFDKGATSRKKSLPTKKKGTMESVPEMNEECSTSEEEESLSSPHDTGQEEPESPCAQDSGHESQSSLVSDLETQDMKLPERKPKILLNARSTGLMDISNLPRNPVTLPVSKTSAVRSFSIKAVDLSAVKQGPAEFDDEPPRRAKNPVKTKTSHKHSKSKKAVKSMSSARPVRSKPLSGMIFEPITGFAGEYQEDSD